MRKKLIGVLLILLAALVIVQDYFIKWEISIWMLAWVVLLAILSLSSLLKRHFGLGFAYGIVALFSLNGQFHFLPVSNWNFAKFVITPSTSNAIFAIKSLHYFTNFFTFTVSFAFSSNFL